MKKKITRIWGIGFVVILTVSLLLSASPALGKELEWGTESIPSTTGFVLLADDTEAGGDVTDFAVGADGMTIWALSDEVEDLWKSTDGGLTWSSKSIKISTVDMIDTAPRGVAIAPDDEDIVAVYADDCEVYVTVNGGSSWGDLGTVVGGTADAADNLYDIAISAESDGKHYVAVVGDDAAGGAIGANVWYFDLGATTPGWTDLKENDGFGQPGTAGGFTTQDVVQTVAFSPNFASDMVMLTVALDSANNEVNFEMFSFNQKLWNEEAGFTAYPVELMSATVATMTAADIALAPDYLGSDDSLRVAFVALDTNFDANDGIYRLKDTSDKGIKTGENAYSVAYDGTNLVAGESGDNAIWRTDEPLVSSPTFSTTSSLKRPSGQDVIVRWNGADVVAGTSGDDSSYSISRDNGKSFNDISLVDGPFYDIQDLAVSADGSEIYLLADDGTDVSLWRKASTWERVLTIDDPSTVPYIVRAAPDDFDSVYVAEIAGRTMYYSSEGGDTKWFNRSARYDVQDLAIESADTLYIAVDSEATVSKSTNSGFTWGSSKSASLAGGDANMIVSLGEDELIVISDTGYVSYSTDGNSNWTKIKKATAGVGLGQVTASGLDDGDFIYAGTSTVNDYIYRWEIGESDDWSKKSSQLGTNEYVSGLQLMDGTLYAFVVDYKAGVNSSSLILRSLDPDASSPNWSTVNVTADFVVAPQALRLSSGSTKIWGIDYDDGSVNYDEATESEDDEVYSYEDTLAAAGPDLSSPGDGALIMVNPVSGGTYSVSFTWDRPSKANIYQMDIALDSGFKEKIMSTLTVPETGTSTSDPKSQLITGDNLMPETTYYWRIRVASDGPIYSPFSSVRSFSIGALPEAEPPVIVQAPPPAPVIQVPPAPAITLQPPEIVLPAPPPAPPDIVIPAAPPPAAPAIPPWTMIVIIIIGAVLVIALIVLIMRTRRPV